MEPVPSIDNSQDSNAATDRVPPIILAGPPGSGKSSLGAGVCAELGLGFLDLSRPHAVDDAETAWAELESAVTDRAADVMALSWALQQDRGVLHFARRAGELVLLWAHPLDMQARSGYDTPIFTPSPRTKTRGGFGRNGTGCREFRRLYRACPETLLLVGASFEEAAEALKELIVALHAEARLPAAEREGLDHLGRKWRQDHDADPQAVEVVVEAMTRFFVYLRATGMSPRGLTPIRLDLDAAAMLVFSYDTPSATNVLDCFSYPPWELEFGWKFSDSAALRTRYRRNLQRFARFLQREGLIDME